MIEVDLSNLAKGTDVCHAVLRDMAGDPCRRI
jgi:hypothetical protein